MLKSAIKFTALTFGLLAATASANAQSTKVLEKFKDWVVYSHTGNPADICFVTAQPRESKPVGYKKERSFFYVS